MKCEACKMGYGHKRTKLCDIPKTPFKRMISLWNGRKYEVKVS